MLISVESKAEHNGRSYVHEKDVGEQRDRFGRWSCGSRYLSASLSSLAAPVGATGEEVHRTLPGDDQIPHPDTQWTRAITVKAKSAAVWPWLVQIGHGRGG